MHGLRGFSDYFVVEPGREHIGNEQTAKFDIEGKRRCEKGMTHSNSSECLATGQQLVIDGADLVQNLTESVIVG